MKSRAPLDVALVGMACRFPGAGDVFSFWKNILEGRDCTSEVPPSRWDPAEFYDPASHDNDRVYCKRGGFLDEPIRFDPLANGVMPSAVAGGEPEQFLVLEAARAALADAGLATGLPDGKRVEVVIGRGNYFNRGNLTRLQHGRIVAQTLSILHALHPEWTAGQLDAVRSELKSSLPPFGPDTVPGQLTNATAGRVANRLDLAGASFVVDAASASALVALDLGARALVARRADLALVGAVYLMADVDFPMVFCQLGALSRSGCARPFAQGADGTLPGEGVGVVVLKRLADAERDGDRVYAVLKGVGLASDGRRHGLATPSAKGHARAMRRALRQANVDPRSVDLIEGHGLGVPASDRAELRALAAVYPKTERTRRTLGAVSSMIGHAMPAAGMAGLIKSALALHHRVLPPTLHVDEPHALLAGPESAFALNDETRPWIHGTDASPRRAAVNAFGFAGISAHAILEEHAVSAQADTPGCMPQWDSEAILLGAPDRAAWLELARALVGWLEQEPPATLKDLAYTLNVGQPAYPFRVGLVASTLADLRDRLREAIERLGDPACATIRDARGAYYWSEPLATQGGLAFVFPGEGSQYPGMLADLCPHFPEVRALFDTADRVAREQGHERLPSEHVFGRKRTEATDDLWEMETAINVVLSAQWALYQLLSRLELRPYAVLGHSSGEFLALAAAGVLRVDSQLEDQLGALGTIFQRLESSGDVPRASLVAIAADRECVEAVCREAAPGLAIAIDNCPHQVVLAGPPEEAALAVARLRGQGILCEELPFARAYHTPQFEPAVAPVREFFAGLPLHWPRVPLYTCATAERMPDEPAAIRRLVVEQWTRPVAFRSTIERMHQDGIRLFVEVGARGNLAGFVEDSLRGRPHFACAANLPRRSGITQLNHLVAMLFAQGVCFKPDHLYVRRRPQRLDLSAEVRKKKPAPALAVGFPEMRLSDELIESLRADDPARDFGRRVVSPHAHTNGHAAHQGHSNTNGSTPHKNGAPIPVPNETALPDLDDAAVCALGVESAEEAMLEHMRTMESFLETQRAVMDAYWQTAATPALATEPSAEETPAVGPWVGDIVAFEPGHSLVAHYTLDADGDPVAQNHTLGGRRVSALDRDRKGLPVLPFTVMAEMLAQAAAALAPGRTLVAMRDVRAHRWVRYEDEPITLALRAESESPNAIRATISLADAPPGRSERRPRPLVEGVFVFDKARPPAPVASAFELPQPRKCRFVAEELYRDQWLFHGPAFQALVRVGQSSPGGIEGTLRVLPREALLRAGEKRGLLSDAIVLDAFTHLLGCWGLDEFVQGDVIFPLRMGGLEIYGDDVPEGTQVECRIQVKEADRHRVRVEAELVRPDGRLWMRINDWDDWRFYWPSCYRDQFRDPAHVLLGEPIEVAGANGQHRPEVQVVWLEPPADMGKPVWREVLEWVQLGPNERRALRADKGSDARLTLRLWGRIAAKEAVRRLWLARGAQAVFPADLVIEQDARGRPHLLSLLEPERHGMPAISIAHTEGVAVAIAAHDPHAHVGIDVERVVARSPEFEAHALAPAERSLLDNLSPALRAEWVTRLWCAKEAVGKATGFGLLGRPLGIVAEALDPQTGTIAMRLGPELSAVCPELAGSVVRVQSAQRGEYVWACTLGERRGE